ncbi:hypothetical protein B566_EDAN016368 [Ephemera danica]|nr:hypothetical protein B566_EDAN016368 [Ephemera danica]
MYSLQLANLTPLNLRQSNRTFVSFNKLSEWYQNFWRPPPPKPPFKHVCQIGDPILRQKTESVEPSQIQTDHIRKVIKSMRNVMKTYDAVGLAAPQIGVHLRIIAIEFSASRRKEFDEKTYKSRQMETVPFRVFINPEIKIITGDKIKYPESCESIKGYSALVPRYSSVNVSGYDEKGERVEWLAKGWSARIVQHEVDHLDGKLYTDHMERSSFGFSYWHSVNVRSGRFSLTFAPFKKW